ncbi:hypothetical protein LSTR_LSTR000525 [Laodelphax striatellus]|uniref:Uncharacterized protein n=1 Tax=Laodelphax striatellus TaxID=195883 RepID=A0A482WZQ0_LAOST|nr:hypothetical protein LSTR_LSTR000525 [Laodelphax striatellus]
MENEDPNNPTSIVDGLAVVDEATQWAPQTPIKRKRSRSCSCAAPPKRRNRSKSKCAPKPKRRNRSKSKCAPKPKRRNRSKSKSAPKPKRRNRSVASKCPAKVDESRKARPKTRAKSVVSKCPSKPGRKASCSCASPRRARSTVKFTVTKKRRAKSASKSRAPPKAKKPKTSNCASVMTKIQNLLARIQRQKKQTNSKPVKKPKKDC